MGTSATLWPSLLHIEMRDRNSATVRTISNPKLPISQPITPIRSVDTYFMQQFQLGVVTYLMALASFAGM